MRALSGSLAVAFSVVLATATVFAQGSGSAGSATPTSSVGSAGPGSAGPGSAGSGSAAGSAGGSASAPVADPVPTPAPAVDPIARQRICEQALVNPPGGDTRFVTDAQSYALGQMAVPQLSKSLEGQACIDAINGVNDFRAAASTLAQEREAKRLAAEVELQHENAAKAIAKNQKHVILAYAALWLLAAGFLLFLWRRQQSLKGEIANLKRDLDAATK